MNIQIRENIFETNSSSTHSFTISNKGDYLFDDLPVDKDGDIVLTGGEFGWQWVKYTNILTKANYCAVFAIIQEEYGDSHYKDILTEVLLENSTSGATGVKYNINTRYSSEDESDYSYIDHQSVDDVRNIFKTKESLKDFIFNTESVLYTGNDNESAPDRFYDRDDEKYYSVLSLGAIEDKNSIHFKNKPSNIQIIDAMMRIIECDNKICLIRDGSNLTIVNEDDSSYFNLRQFIRENLDKSLYAIYDYYEYMNKGMIDPRNFTMRIPRIKLNNDLIAEDYDDVIQIKFNYEIL